MEQTHIDALSIHLPLRRLEDKLDAKFLDNVAVNVRMAEPHNNKKHALLYPALVCWSGDENLFQTSKLVVDRLTSRLGASLSLSHTHSLFLFSLYLALSLSLCLSLSLLSLCRSRSLSFSPSVFVPTGILGLGV